MPKLETIVKALHATTGELKEIVTALETEFSKRAKVDMTALAEQARDKITDKLLALASKLNK